MKKLFRVEFPDDTTLWVWALYVADAIHFVCPKAHSSYKSIKGSGLAWEPGATDAVFFKEVK